MNKKVYVSERAVISRVRRALVADEKILCICRENSRWILDLGRYYVTDLRTSAVIEKDIHLEKFARKIGALEKYEIIKD